MNRKLGLLLALVLVWWFFIRDKGEAEPPQDETLAETPAETEPEPKPVKKRQRTTAVPAAKSSGPQMNPTAAAAPQMAIASAPRDTRQPEASGQPAPIPKGAVSFEVIEGLAVAYGDIVLGVPPEDFKNSTGVTIPQPPKYWSEGAVPYHIPPNIPNKAEIIEAVEYFNQNTPVRFVPFEGQADALVFEPAKQGCRSYLGMIGGHQPIYLGPECRDTEVVHELMHALGFVHEQSRTDRDAFVEIVWDHVQPDKRPQFEIVPDDLMGPIKGSSFDYQSAMLYHDKAFGKEKNLITIRSKSGEAIEPVKSGLSRQDLDRVFRAYR